MALRAKKKARRSGPSDTHATHALSGALAVDLREVVLRGLRTIAYELADIFGRRLGAGDVDFATSAGKVGLDLVGFAQRLGRGELVDASEERFRVLIHCLLDIAADLGGFADRTSSCGLD